LTCKAQEGILSAVVNRDLIDDYLARHDLVVVREGDAWRGTFPVEGRSFRFLLSLEPGWLRFAVVPLVAGVADDGGCRRLLELNRDLLLCKLALEADGSVALRCELPTADLDFSEFREALDALRRYATQIAASFPEPGRSADPQSG
jgi:hypothetical protein